MGPLIPLFWTSGDVCPRFQSQGGFLHLRASLPVHKGFLRFTSGATPAFSTNSGVHCISMYTAWLARLLSYASGFEPPTQWWSLGDLFMKPSFIRRGFTDWLPHKTMFYWVGMGVELWSAFYMIPSLIGDGALSHGGGWRSYLRSDFHINVYSTGKL